MRNKLKGSLLLLCVLLMASMNLGMNVQAEQGSMFLGEGTAENPYLIESAEQLFQLGEYLDTQVD